MEVITKESLQLLAKRDISDGINAKFESDSQRVDRFSFTLNDVYIDFSKTHISEELLGLYESFAKEINFEDKRYQFLSGARINTTENRAVLHTLLRDSTNQGIDAEEPKFLEQARVAEEDFLNQYKRITEKLSQRAKPIKNIIHVGIGGSSLGTQLVFEALGSVGCEINVHFISNIDAHKLVRVLNYCDPETTLLIGVSKTFNTAETRQNINTIGSWFEKYEVNDWLQQMFAVTSNPDNAIDFGVQESHVIGFPKWVGGRYSVWSAVSLSAAIAIGFDKFKEFLDGAASIDKHFYSAELSNNVCFIAAALDHYYSNFLDVKSRAIFAYDHRLRSLISYLQQLETESNGKDRQLDGVPVDQPTSVVVWGGVGTDVQHSVFQMMHQGTSLIPSEFILVKNPGHGYDDHHLELLANGLAQTAALLSGQDLETISNIHKGKGLSDLELQAKVFSGERPSTTMLVESLTPHVLGSLLAFYEHRTFCSGIFANINSFDQMGVELGKRLAKEIKPLLTGRGDKSVHDFDGSTLGLLKKVKE